MTPHEGLTLLQELAKLTRRTDDLDARTSQLEEQLARMSDNLATLIDRTQENGGTSLKDQLNRIESLLRHMPNI
jgi:ABC-type transporter Mla subunit MlaD